MKNATRQVCERAARAAIVAAIIAGAAAATLAGTALIATPAHAAELGVVGALRTTAGGPVADGSYILIFKLYDAQSAKAYVWEDVVTGVKVARGQFDLLLGTNKQKPLKDALLTAGKPLWLGVQVGSEPELPRVRLRHVAGAYHALRAASAAHADTAAKADKAKHADTAASAASADKATLADKAKLADKATEAGTANSAATAKFATAAQTASKLQCTGCVGLSELSADVAKGFLSVKGGTVDGKLTVTKGLALGSSAIEGGRCAAVDITKLPGGAANAGELRFDKTTARIFLCDGKAWQRLSVCSESCKTAGLVACGEPVTNGCGDVGKCKGNGTFCSSGVCTAGKCVVPGGSKDQPIKSCVALRDADKGAKTGLYWLDPDGSGGNPAFRTRCEMDTDGGGWTLVSIISSHDGIARMDCNLNWDWADARWTNTATLNPTSFEGTKDHKYASYATVAFSEFLMHESVKGAVGWKRWKVGTYASFATMMKSGCKTLATAPQGKGGAISADNALIYSNNLLVNCNSDYVNKDDRSRLHGNSPGNPQGHNCYNGGWGLGVGGDYSNCSWSSEARPQTGGWTTQCYPFTGFYTGGEMCGAGCKAHHDSGHFIGTMYVR